MAVLKASQRDKDYLSNADHYSENAIARQRYRRTDTHKINKTIKSAPPTHKKERARARESKEKKNNTNLQSAICAMQ
jgi:hypothetical protein